MSNLTEPAPIEGVSLAQYAGARVGRALGAPLEDVLANERIDPSRWPQAEQQWAARLSNLGDEALNEAFDGRLSEARQRYRRSWPPIDESIEAWMAFTRHRAAEPNPNALLESLGMQPDELQLLQWLWWERIAADPVLAEQSRVLMASNEPVDAPAVRPGPVKMLPPPDDSPAGGQVVRDDSLHFPKRVSNTALGETLDESSLEDLPGPIVPQPPPEPAIGEKGHGAPGVRGQGLSLPQRASDTALGETLQDAEVEPQELPFRAAPLTIRQYAAVRVQTDLEPGTTDAVLEQYGLTITTKQALDGELRTACAKEPTIAKAWEQAYATYLEWWKNNRLGKG